MTVKELIEWLQKQPPDVKVYVDPAGEDSGDEYDYEVSTPILYKGIDGTQKVIL